METNELYLKTAFCCIACDGDIAKEEIELLKSLAAQEKLFKNLDIQETINGYISSINKHGKNFLERYLEDVKDAKLDDLSSLQLIKIAIDVIEADNQIEYSEISFFKRIRKQLSISDETILEQMPDKEDYLLPDIETDDAFDWNFAFDNIQLHEIKAEHQ